MNKEKTDISPLGVLKVQLKPIDAMDICSMAFLSRKINVCDDIVRGL
jgi:hypothetical protein